MKHPFNLFFLIIVSLSFSLDLDAQNNPQLDFSKKEVDELFPFYFPNVNQINFYEDENALNKISKAQQAKNWERFKDLLENYVKQFATENFYKDTRLIWQLAKMEELYGDFEKSKSLYRLALKHHQSKIDLRQMEIFLDSVKLEQTDDYVPIDYYYELVDFRKSIDTLVPPRGVLLSMGKQINSNMEDYAPALTLDNKTMIFTSKRSLSGSLLSSNSNEDLYIAKQVDGMWQDAIQLRDINSRYNEGSATLNAEGDQIIFARCGAPDGFGNCDLYETHLNEDSVWTKAVNLGANLNSKAWDSHPTLSVTGDTLFYASDRIGGFGLADIYFSVRGEDNNWTTAKNLGPIVNTRGNEVSPFIHPRYNILYFSSNGHLLNFGGFDIYKSNAKSFLWDEPKNIGPLINTEGDEYYFTIDSESEDLFYAGSSSMRSRNLDLFSFPLPMEAMPGADTKVSGIVTDTVQGQPFRGIVSIVDIENGIEIAPKFTREDGSFEFNLINNANYVMVVQSDKLFRIEEMFFLSGDTVMNRNIDPISSKIRFKSIEFEKNSAKLRPDMYSDLDKVVDFLLDYPEFKLKISGHTDSSGDELRNKSLSQERADAIRDYIIILHPIEEDRVVAEGYGNSRPVVQDEETDDDRRLNRRVEFEIYRPKSD
ncbi:WD40-like Beta Propeller Repeat [Marivirga sericea]|uniref:WD40-like Beta Propeller Repeat n=1 Tax=Marivirga sericea TaxID=1028 RepID=A0A1X7IRA1_9BACT|nr:OmpA family protein [Marivirga sericea]SMG17513.1 WD40-like Beta Propeller Repeat [Marivirga sericea]